MPIEQRYRVLYFGALASALGQREETVHSGAATVAELQAQLIARGGAWAALEAPSVRCAVNQCLAAPETALPTACEVAFFPPVTGG